MSFDPFTLTTGETHTRAELVAKLAARNAALDPVQFPHRFPDADGHYDTLRGAYTPDQDADKLEAKMLDVKRRKSSMRPSDWQKYGYAKTFRSKRAGWLQTLAEIEANHVADSTTQGVMGADRFDYRDVSYEWFVEKYEKPSLPCLIAGFADEWPMNKWTFETMNKSFLRDERVKVGKDDEGYRIGLETKYYLQYAANNKDDSPVYLFESQLAANQNIKKIFNDYARPAWFSKDLFDYCHADRRPPHRWMCLGPERSGTTMHIDPLNTNAWNTVIAGRKVWILFPPNTPEAIVKGKQFWADEDLDPDIENEGVGWYDRVYPKLRAWIMANGNKYGLREFIQYPGETIFVPGSWWHFVINLDDTWAMTQNYTNMSNFPLVWRDVRVERKHMAWRWLHSLEKRFPKAAALAHAMNSKDKFSWKFVRPHLDRFGKKVKPRALMCPEELAAAEERDRNDPLATGDWSQWDKKPFAYAGWEDYSGGEDSSTDSDASSDDDDDDDDDKDAEAEATKKAAADADAAAAAAADENSDADDATGAGAAGAAAECAAENEKIAPGSVRDPVYGTFLKDYVPQSKQSAIDAIFNVIRRKKEPRWGLKDWTKHAYASDIPLLRAALSRWCALVEAAHCGALAPAAAAAAAAGPIPDPRNPFVGDPALTRAADGVPATELKQIVLPEALAPLAGLEAPMAAAAAYIFPKSSRAFTCLASLRATEPLPPQLRVPPRTRGSAPGGGELVTINFASFRPIPRFNYRDMSYAVFQATYERPLLPCLISGMTEGWAMNEYTGTSLSTGKYRNCRLKIGKCPDGYRLTAKLKHFMQYLYTQHDDQPLYLFESQLEVIPVAEEMQQDYTRPNFFQTDFFDSVAFSRRPPQRWLCIGAQGSGSFMHKDPLNTNAWNALVQGRKYWVLLSPNVPASLATGAQFERRYNGEGPSSWAPPQGWFTHTLPQLRAAIAEANAGGAGYVLYEVMHFPGETIFVPGNWWHAVWNLDDTLAITQNYVNESNFDDVWPLTRGRRKHMAARWLAAMDKDAPAAAARARELDARDGFKAVFSKGSLRRKAERRARIAAKQARTAAAIAAAAGAGAGAEAKDAGKEENKKAEEDDDDHASDEEPSGEWDSSTNSDDTE